MFLFFWELKESYFSFHIGYYICGYPGTQSWLKVYRSLYWFIHYSWTGSIHNNTPQETYVTQSRQHQPRFSDQSVKFAMSYLLVFQIISIEYFINCSRLHCTTVAIEYRRALQSISIETHCIQLFLRYQKKVSFHILTFSAPFGGTSGTTNILYWGGCWLGPH